ncbi:MAG: alpha/beta fold hydrolase [Clostridia bacterium]|nr:alpha/beta fold hydrolase [Clostridia bacterium]
MYQEITVPDDGISLSAVLETPEGAEEGERLPLVILLHGFGSSKNRTHTLQAAEAMRAEGFATLRPDLFGHGESGGEFRRHTLYKWIGNTMAVIDCMRGLGYRDLYLSGHSQGGLTAALVAGMEPDRIRGLILRAPAFLIPQGAREGNLLGYSFDPERIPDSVPLPQGVTLDGDYIRVAQTVHAEEAADRFKGPVLILQGDADDVVPPETVRPYAARFTDCEPVLIKGEGHHFDRRPEETAERIRNFMKKLRKQRARDAENLL